MLNQRIQTKPTTWRCGRFLFDFAKRNRPIVMGILNATPDSFSDGGKFRSPIDAIAHAERMLADGVDLIDSAIFLKALLKEPQT